MKMYRVALKRKERIVKQSDLSNTISHNSSI